MPCCGAASHQQLASDAVHHPQGSEHHCFLEHTLRPMAVECRQTLDITFISFMDAAIVFTDTEFDPDGPAIVVLFRFGHTPVCTAVYRTQLLWWDCSYCHKRGISSAQPPAQVTDSCWTLRCCMQSQGNCVAQHVTQTLGSVS